jgi:hypothetical protein
MTVSAHHYDNHIDLVYTNLALLHMYNSGEYPDHCGQCTVPKYNSILQRLCLSTITVISIILQILKFSKEDIGDIRKLLAAILHLGNVDFTGPKDGHFSRVTNQKQVGCV